MPNRVRAGRLAHGFTQEELARRAGVSRGLVSLIENGRTVPSVYVAVALARVLRTAVEDLFPAKEVKAMASDRRSGTKKGVPHVGKQPRARTVSGAWRRKRSDAGKPRTKPVSPKRSAK